MLSKNAINAITIAGIIISLALFIGLNQTAFSHVLHTLSIENELITLMLLIAVGFCTSLLSFRDNKKSVLIVMLLPLSFLLASVSVYTTFSPFNIPKITQFAAKQIPVDGGWLGFVLILITGYLLSHILTRNGVDTIERLLLSIGLGAGVTYTLMILLGILWETSTLTTILTQIILILTLLITALYKGFKPHLKLPELKKEKIRLSQSNLLKIALLTVIGMYAFFAIYQTIAYPSVEWDALAYGVNYANIIFEKKEIPVISGPSIGLEMSANYPPGVQSLAVYLYIFAGNQNDFYYRILQPIFGLTTMIVTYKFTAITTKNKLASIFAIFALCAMPVFWEVFIHETYLMCLTLMTTLAAYFFFKACNSTEPHVREYEVIGTLFCGFSALSSYIGIFSFGILLLYAIHRKLQKRRFILLCILASLIILPWYMRNIVLLGNPFYPFFDYGSRLDSLLRTSTVQHFHNWLQIPLYELVSNICKITAVSLFLTIIYLIFAKSRNFVVLLFLYLPFVGILTMAFHIPFSRYISTSLPILAVALSIGLRSLFTKKHSIEKITAVVLVLLIIGSGANVFNYIYLFKPTYANVNNEWDYLSNIFEEADAWKWINENTPLNARIATYDIKQFYIERDVMSLDGYEAVPLYNMTDVEEAINYLKQHNVTYILSVPWTAPLDTRMLPAYKWCILTRYLGDPKYLPPVYVSSSGTTVYNVGAIEEKVLYENFSRENFVPPIKYVKINLTITNETSPPSGKFQIPIPVDYREGLMMVSVNSSGHKIGTELWQGVAAHQNSIRWWEKFEVAKKWPQHFNITDVENPSFVWQVESAGYFTFVAVDRELSEGNFTITVDVRFYNYWDVKSLFVSEGLETHNIWLSNETSLQMNALYIQIDEPAVLSINSTTFGRKISLEIFKDFVPNNVVINWTEQYRVIKQQPYFNITLGEVNPSIQNMFLSYGNYTILVIRRDNFTIPINILLETNLTTTK